MLDVLNWNAVGRWLHVGPARVPPAWRSVMIGRCRGAEPCRAMLAEAAVHVSADADTLLGHPDLRWSDRKRVVELAIATPADLGFARGARWAEIRSAARAVRLGLGAAEIAPMLRLAYRDQPAGERLIVAMQPVGDPEREPLSFSLDHDDEGLWLDVHDGHPDVFWRPDDRFVFVRKPSRWGF
ncbi:hypothetical protein [Rhodoplanes sp. SY1]|uniref:hypothetical protein n=1 Tax=Rhodoplanes sp. SY1 TaxID=3166646 RepID=UPI0038B66858